MPTPDRDVASSARPARTRRHARRRAHGRDADELYPGERQRHRAQALRWLAEQVDVWDAAREPSDAATVAQAVGAGLADLSFADVREGPGFEKLPANEQAAGRALWTRIRARN